MADLIDRNALLEQIQFRRPVIDMGTSIIYDCVELTRRIIEEAPAVDAEPVKHGRWIDQCCYNTCSACDVSICMWDDDGYIQNFAYCPKCGAKMDGGADDE